MNAFLTAAVFALLIAAAAYVIHRLNGRHADRIAPHHYSTPRPGRRGRGGPRPPVEPRPSRPPSDGERRDHHDGGHGRFPPRHRSGTAHQR
jgi:hypothetical protein